MRLYLFTIEGAHLVGKAAYTAMYDAATLADAQRMARDAGADAFMLADDSGQSLTAICAASFDKRNAAFAAAANVIWN